MTKITFTIEDDLANRFAEQLKTTGRDQDEFLSEMIKRSLTIDAVDELRKKFVPRAQKLGINTDEDVFKIVS